MTGLQSHDEMCGGFLGSEMIILAGRPGEGKTVFGMQISKHAAMRGTKTLFVSLEMKDQELVSRMLCGMSGVNSLLIRNGTYTEDHTLQIEEASSTIGVLPLYVWDKAASTVAKIRAVAKQMKSDDSLDFLVVDYLGKVKPSDYRVSRVDQIGQIARDLKDLAKELDIPVLVLCQLNRGADDEVPKLKNLADSADVEREADVVLFLHPDRKSGRTKLIIAKHRHGETGLLEIQHDKRRMCFVEPEPDWVHDQEARAQHDFEQLQ
ncbi:DnaB-like helicase C-terminal domain-containing protein [Bremerella sp. P1]|uniref:DnaB-like helicase C-terminal domain-containing protein n=1 Tax=Bremerella sp. P1 TaxID=3026424 RepID=UPI002368A9BE|nr:DnaB-like helicase C-terminal domain-containing protein [Bremerella sp. P1]WDI42107.1 DnaB-like helicase C-terminal domain-containing protein [Bremerella sp. P1]